MSSMLLARDHNGRKRGEVVSVPPDVGREMIAAGIAVRWDSGRGVLPPLPGEEPATAEIEVASAPSPEFDGDRVASAPPSAAPAPKKPKKPGKKAGKKSPAAGDQADASSAAAGDDQAEAPSADPGDSDAETETADGDVPNDSNTATA